MDMEAKIDSFVFYRSYLEKFEELLSYDKELAVKWIDYIMKYALGECETTNDPMLKILSTEAIALIEKNKKRYVSSTDAKKQFKAIDKDYKAIADLVIQGKTQKEIAQVLNIKQGTVSKRLADIQEHYPELLNVVPEEEIDFNF